MPYKTVNDSDCGPDKQDRNDLKKIQQSDSTAFGSSLASLHLSWSNPHHLKWLTGALMSYQVLLAISHIVGHVPRHDRVASICFTTPRELQSSAHETLRCETHALKMLEGALCNVAPRAWSAIMHIEKRELGST